MPGSYAESINTVYSTPAEYDGHEGKQLSNKVCVEPNKLINAKTAGATEWCT